MSEYKMQMLGLGRGVHSTESCSYSLSLYSLHFAAVCF